MHSGSLAMRPVLSSQNTMLPLEGNRGEGELCTYKWSRSAFPSSLIADSKIITSLKTTTDFPVTCSHSTENRYNRSHICELACPVLRVSPPLPLTLPNPAAPMYLIPSLSLESSSTSGTKLSTQNIYQLSEGPNFRHVRMTLCPHGL